MTAAEKRSLKGEGRREKAEGRRQKGKVRNFRVFTSL
jgi:hypothetical protein